MIINVVYDQNCKFILDIISKYMNDYNVHTYNFDHYQEKKKALPIMTQNGTRNLPLITVTSEEIDKVFWCETTSDWKTELDNFFKNIKIN